MTVLTIELPDEQKAALAAKAQAKGLSTSIQLCVSGSVNAEYEEVINCPRFQGSEDIVAGMLRAIREKGA